MKLNIEKAEIGNRSHRGNDADYYLMSDDGVTGSSTGCLYRTNGRDNAYVARLFQSAEELLEYVEYALRERLFDDGYPYTRESLKKTVAYIKTGDKDDMVTLRMSRESAGKINLLKFEVKE